MIVGDGLGVDGTVDGVAVLCVDVLEDEQRPVWVSMSSEEVSSLFKSSPRLASSPAYVSLKKQKQIV